MTPQNMADYQFLQIGSFNIEKIIDIKPNCFLPKPKVDSSLLLFSPKKNFLN